MALFEQEVEKYLAEEQLNFETNGENGDKTLKCPSCRMVDFVHADGICELDCWRIILSLWNKSNKVEELIEKEKNENNYCWW